MQDFSVTQIELAPDRTDPVPSMPACSRQIRMLKANPGARVRSFPDTENRNRRTGDHAKCRIVPLSPG